MLNYRALVRTAVATFGVATASFITAAPAHAQLSANSNSVSSSNAPSVYIGGPVNIDAKTNVLTAIAINNSRAHADQCKVYESVYIAGALTMTCKSNVQTAIAINDSVATADQGVIGAKKD